jgi:ribose transport system permease protein
VFAGVQLLSAIDTAINIMGLDASYMQVIRGVLMLGAVLLDSLKDRGYARPIRAEPGR